FPTPAWPACRSAASGATASRGTGIWISCRTSGGSSASAASPSASSSTRPSMRARSHRVRPWRSTVNRRLPQASRRRMRGAASRPNRPPRTAGGQLDRGAPGASLPRDVCPRQTRARARLRKLFIKTYGCQMNAYDSARMAELLAPHGYGLTAAAAEADLVILNTCHIREKAGEKVYSEIGRLRELKAEVQLAGKAGFTIAVAGCVAQAEGAEMLRRAPIVDLVVGPQAYHRLPELLAQLGRGDGAERLATDFPVDSKFDHLPEAASAV